MTLKELINTIQPADKQAYAACVARFNAVAKPVGSLGKLETLLQRIAAITGSSRENRAVRGSRFLLSRQDETIYTAELLQANENWRYGVTADEVREGFSLIAAEWSAGDY